MLKLILEGRPEKEEWDEEKEEFIKIPAIKGGVLKLEHSLLSISKWESIWHKPFLSEAGKTEAETISYIRCMTISQDVDPNLYNLIGNKEIDEVNEYIADPMTATWFSEDKKNGKSGGKPQITTNEIVYDWLIYYGMDPSFFEKWHFNHLMTLLRVRELKEAERNGNKKNAKNGPMSSQDAAKNASIMKARREAAKTKHH